MTSWKTRLPYKKPSLRLTVMAIVNKDTLYTYDVGYNELVDLKDMYDDLTIVEMGKFGEGGEMEGSNEHKKILDFVKEKGIKIGRSGK